MLYANGCSFTYGTGLPLKDRAWPYVLAEKLNIDSVETDAQRGVSNNYIVLYSNINSNSYLRLIGEGKYQWINVNTKINDDIVLKFYYIFAWKKKLSRHYSISSKQSYSIIEVAKMFKSKIRYLSKRPGERYASALTKMNLSNKVYRYFGKIRLTDYIGSFIDSRK